MPAVRTMALILAALLATAGCREPIPVSPPTTRATPMPPPPTADSRAKVQPKPTASREARVPSEGVESGKACLPSEDIACFFDAELEHVLLLLERIHHHSLVLVGSYPVKVDGALEIRSLARALSNLSGIASQSFELLDVVQEEDLTILGDRAALRHPLPERHRLSCSHPVEFNIQRGSLDGLASLVAKDLGGLAFAPEISSGAEFTAIGSDIDPCRLLEDVAALAQTKIRRTGQRLEFIGVPSLPPFVGRSARAAPSCDEGSPTDCWKAEELEVVAVAGAEDGRMALVRHRFSYGAFVPVTWVRERSRIGRDGLEISRIDEKGILGVDGTMIVP